MAQKQGQTVKGCRKCGRGKKKEAAKGSAISLFVRGKIDGRTYFNLTGQKAKG